MLVPYMTGSMTNISLYAQQLRIGFHVADEGPQKQRLVGVHFGGHIPACQHHTRCKHTYNSQGTPLQGCLLLHQLQVHVHCNIPKCTHQAQYCTSAWAHVQHMTDAEA